MVAMVAELVYGIDIYSWYPADGPVSSIGVKSGFDAYR